MHAGARVVQSQARHTLCASTAFMVSMQQERCRAGADSLPLSPPPDPHPSLEPPLCLSAHTHPPVTGPPHLSFRPCPPSRHNNHPPTHHNTTQIPDEEDEAEFTQEEMEALEEDMQGDFEVAEMIKCAWV